MRQEAIQYTTSRFFSQLPHRHRSMLTQYSRQSDCPIYFILAWFVRRASFAPAKTGGRYPPAQARDDSDCLSRRHVPSAVGASDTAHLSALCSRRSSNQCRRRLLDRASDSLFGDQLDRVREEVLEAVRSGLPDVLGAARQLGYYALSASKAYLVYTGIVWRDELDRASRERVAEVADDSRDPGKRDATPQRGVSRTRSGRRIHLRR